MNMKFLWKFILVGFVVSVFITSCNDTLKDSYPQLDVSKKEISLNVGARDTVVIFGGSGNYELSYSSNSIISANIEKDSLLLVEGLKDGSSYINISDKKTKIFLTINVSVHSVHVLDINISEYNSHLNINDNVQINASIVPDNATNKKLLYSSSNENVATVSSEGNVVAHNGGEVTITVQSEDGRISKTLDFLVASDLPNGFMLSEDGALTGHSFSEFPNPVFVVPFNVVSIGEDAFRNRNELTKIILPEGLTQISRNAFKDCSGLTEIVIPGSLSGNAAWGVNLFDGCTSLKKVVIKDGVTNIGRNAFRYCSSLVDVTLPSSITKIDASAFVGCSLLSSIEIPSNVQNIGSNVFFNCLALKRINVASDNEHYSSVDGVLYNKEHTAIVAYPMGIESEEYSILEGVSEIPSSMFTGNTHLKRVVFPASLTKIGFDVFKNVNLNTIEFMSSTPPRISFDAFNKQLAVTVIVPQGALSAYQNAFRSYKNYVIQEKN